MGLAPIPGDVLGGKYRVLHPLGEGGMGAVFAAENLRTQKRVAIKWLQPELARREEGSARLVREAQAAARVRHRNVVDVYDVECEGDAIFLVMEYLEGEPLTAVLRRRNLRMDQLLALLLPAMRGVAAAHKQGIVHRDIKPDNIFLAREDGVLETVPKVLDFGIAKLTRHGPEHLSITASGSTVGTPLYMSYEQLAGLKDVDGRADVYAFGVILYEALTGRPPFEAESLSELCFKIATQPARPPRSLRGDIPARLSEIVLRAMAKARAERTPNMEALIRELEPFASQAGFLASMTAPHAQVPALGAAPEPQPATEPMVDDAPRIERALADVPDATGTPAHSTSALRASRRALARSASGVVGLSVVLGGLAALATREPREPSRVEHPAPSGSGKPAVRARAPLNGLEAPASPEVVQLHPTRVAGAGYTERSSGVLSADVIDAATSEDQDASTRSEGIRRPVHRRANAGQQTVSSAPEPVGGVQDAPADPALPTSSESGFRVNQRPSADEF